MATISGTVESLHLFTDLRRGLVSLLAALGPDDWTRATACAGWSVHDVALHIAGGMLANVSRRRDGHHVNCREFSPDASVEIDAVTAWRLATKGIDPGEARVEGDGGLAEGFFNLVAILA